MYGAESQLCLRWRHTVAMSQQLRLRATYGCRNFGCVFFVFCVSLMTPRVASGRVLGRPCSTARLEYADAAATVHVCLRLH